MRCFRSPMAVDTILSEEVLICSIIRLRQQFCARRFLLRTTVEKRQKSESFLRTFHIMNIVLCTTTFTLIFFSTSFQRELDIVRPCVVSWVMTKFINNTRHGKHENSSLDVACTRGLALAVGGTGMGGSAAGTRMGLLKVTDSVT